MKIYEKFQVDEIAEAIKDGQVVALPTETVYGLAVLADNVQAINKLDLIKQRKHGKKYALMLAGVERVSEYGLMDSAASNVVEEYLPGELTLVLPKNPNYENDYFDNYSTIGIRVPDDDFLQKLIRVTGPIIVTSANISGEEPCLRSFEIMKNMPDVDVCVAGQAGGHPPTTVATIHDGKLVVLRRGGMSLSE